MAGTGLDRHLPILHPHGGKPCHNYPPQRFHRSGPKLPRYPYPRASADCQSRRSGNLQLARTAKVPCRELGGGWSSLLICLPSPARAPPSRSRQVCTRYCSDISSDSVCQTGSRASKARCFPGKDSEERFLHGLSVCAIC